MKSKPALSFWQIWNMSFGFLGIQFGFALQNANVSRIFQTLGAKIDDIPILWIAAPVTGLIIQPIIGHLSDNTWGKLGRRRPFFLIGAIFASLALIAMPNSPLLWVAAGTLWIMDASINISMEPFRAFVGDMLPNEQRTKGFAMQSFFIGIGAVIASLLPYMLTNWFGVSNIAPEGEIPLSVQLSFYIGASVFILAVLTTIFTTREYSPEELASFENEVQNSTETEISNQAKINTEQAKIKTGLIGTAIGIITTAALFFIHVEKEVYILGYGIIAFGLIELYSGLLQKRGNNNGIVSVISDLNTMPKTMKQLAIVQFFSWFALFAMWIYTTAAVTGHIYGTQDSASEAYNNGADWVGVLFAVYNGMAAVFAFLLVLLAKKTSRKATHAISLIVGGLSLVSIYFISDPKLLIIPFVGIGLAWASILAMPYAILTGSLPAKKMGIYMGIFNFFIVIPQILASSILGAMTKHLFSGEAIYALIVGGVSMGIAALSIMLVEDNN